MPEKQKLTPDQQRAYIQYERPIRVRQYKLGCLLAMVFMPIGATLDFLVYGKEVMFDFLAMRFLASVLLLLVWMGLNYGGHLRWYRVLGMFMALIPLGSILWMIHLTGSAESPYYAGLNLIMLGAAILCHWSLADSIIIFLLTFVSYVAVTFDYQTAQHTGIWYNNIYFLIVTGVFLMAGAWYFDMIRASEFVLRFSLDENRAQLANANSQLEDTNKKLLELDETKSRFFANISHELRTPLTLLIAPLETLRSLGDDLSRDEREEMCETMHGNAMRLLKLINDLLELVRLESGGVQFRPESVDVADFIKGISTSVRHVAKDKHIQLTTHCEEGMVPIMLDVDRLERISLNLVFNALKFTPAGGKVDLTARKEGECLRLDVRDTGVGIAADQLPHIFDRFWQADTSSQRRFQGMGIGLALVRELVEAQGGKVNVESTQGKGTCMTILLPFIPVNADEADEPVETDELDQVHGVANQEWIGRLYRRAELYPAMTSLQASMRPVEVPTPRFSSRPKLLVADDEPDMLRFLKSQLRGEFEVIEAVDGEQAVEKAAQFLPHIILSDMMMPGKDGLQVCRELREKTSTRSIPVVLLTARADERTKLECLKAGASDFLSKPFSMTELSVRLHNLVSNRLYQMELATQKQQLEAALDQVKETETLLVQSEKLAALGRMSAGLIHEINNPLNFAGQGLHILRQYQNDVPDGSRADFTEVLTDVENGVNRVVRIISDLRGFTRSDGRSSGAFQLKPVMETALRFFAHEFKDGVRVESEVPEGLEIRADSSQFTQVVVNLVQNALDAMRSREDYPEGESPLLRIHAEEVDGVVRLRVSDNGPGISDEIRDKIFDPFFTTKDVGKGMGLGLSICHRIIHEHQGHISVNNLPNGGSEFILEFPATELIMS